MNDPHVVALNYRVEHGPEFDYSKASALSESARDFDIRLEDTKVRFTMKTHHATVQDAVDAVEKYIRAWELHVALKRSPNAFTLRFDCPEIVDRNPTMGVVRVSANPARFSFGVSEPKVTVMLGSYPSPPSPSLARNPDVESMFTRYIGYRDGKEPLTSMAYFCLTVLEASAGKKKGETARKAAARRYCIANRVMNKVGTLCDKKGGRGARKAKGVHLELTHGEKRFLEDAVKTMIRRAAEVEHDPHASHNLIGLRDLATK